MRKVNSALLRLGWTRWGEPCDHSHTARGLHSRGICSQGEQIRGSRICERNMTSAAESGVQ
jgi:hypothetical protein